MGDMKSRLAGVLAVTVAGPSVAAAMVPGPRTVDAGQTMIVKGLTPDDAPFVAAIKPCLEHALGGMELAIGGVELTVASSFMPDGTVDRTIWADTPRASESDTEAGDMDQVTITYYKPPPGKPGKDAEEIISVRPGFVQHANGATTAPKSTGTRYHVSDTSQQEIHDPYFEAGMCLRESVPSPEQVKRTVFLQEFAAAKARLAKDDAALEDLKKERDEAVQALGALQESQGHYDKEFRDALENATSRQFGKIASSPNWEIGSFNLPIPGQRVVEQVKVTVPLSSGDVTDLKCEGEIEGEMAITYSHDVPSSEEPTGGQEISIQSGPIYCDSVRVRGDWAGNSRVYLVDQPPSATDPNASYFDIGSAVKTALEQTPAMKYWLQHSKP